MLIRFLLEKFIYNNYIITNMEKKTIFVIVIILIAIGVFLIIKYGPSMTGAAVAGQKKCLSPKAALNFINEKGCVRIYEDPKCAEQGKVEVQC